MADIQVYKRVIDYVGLGAKPIPERSLLLFKELAPVLALMQGMGSDGAGLLQINSRQSLIVEFPTAAQAVGQNVVIRDLNNSDARMVGSVPDASNGQISLGVGVHGFNAATYDRMRTASAAVLAAQLGIGAALTASPGQWVVSNNGAVGAQSSAVRAAAGAGVRHICTGFTIVISSQAAPAAGTLTINLRDGISGVGTVLYSINIQIPAALYQPIVITRSGLAVVGTAATAMTLESSAAYAAVGVSVSEEGYDAA